MSGKLDRYVGNYVDFLQRGKWMVLLSWLMLTFLLAVFGASRLMSLTHNSFDPPAGTASAIARAKMKEYFPGSDVNTTDLIYFEANEGFSVFDDGLLLNVTNDCETYLRANLDTTMYKDMVISGYYSYVNQHLPINSAMLAFVGNKNGSSFLVVQYPRKKTMKYGRVLQGLQKSLQVSHVGPGKASFVGDVGAGFQAVEAIDAATESMMHMDLISVPLAFIVLAISLRSARLLLLPLMTLVVGGVTAFGMMGLLAQLGIAVSSATPPLMMSMLLAVSIDYALFLLTRFKEEVEEGRDILQVTKRMLIYSGHTVCGSGFTLAFCFVALLFFPLQMIQSIGLGVIVSIFSAIVVNLTIVPAAILAMPAFFSNFESCGCSCICRCCKHRQHRNEVEQSCTPLSASADFETKAWFRWAVFSTTPRATGLVVLLLASVGTASLVKVVQFEDSMDTSLMAPRGSISVETMTRFGHSFSMGRTGPYHLLLLPKHAGTIYDQAFWEEATGLLEGIVAETYTGDSKRHGTLSSIMYNYNMDGKHQNATLDASLISFLDPNLHDDIPCMLMSHLPKEHASCIRFVKSKLCQDLGDMAPDMAKRLNISTKEVFDACNLAQSTLQSTTTQARDVLFATLIPSEPMGSKSAVAWTKKCRGLLSQLSKHPHVEAHLNGFTPTMLDAIGGINSRAPTVVAVTMGMCFVLISLLIVSLVFGLSSVILISWTIVVVFTVGMLVYQDGILGTAAPPQLAGTGGLAWIVPPLTFTVILGLGLDYDIFLLGRVCEYRCNGYGDKESIAYGVAKTGPVITSAGIIMALAFAGLMMSSIPMLNQVSLLLVVAVLVDTFFIRSLATPAIHGPLGSLNWWPRSVPLVTTPSAASEVEQSARRVDSRRLVAPQ